MQCNKFILYKIHICRKINLFRYIVILYLSCCVSAFVRSCVFVCARRLFFRRSPANSKAKPCVQHLLFHFGGIHTHTPPPPHIEMSSWSYIKLSGNVYDVISHLSWIFTVMEFMHGTNGIVIWTNIPRIYLYITYVLACTLLMVRYITIFIVFSSSPSPNWSQISAIGPACSDKTGTTSNVTDMICH